MSTYSHPSQVSAAAPLKDNRKKYTFTLTFTSERPIRPFSNADFLQNRFAYIQYLKGKCGITLEGRQAHICHRRDICIKEIWGRWVLTAMSSKDFKLAFIVIEKFKFPQGSLKKAVHQTSELWKATLTKGLIPGGYVLNVDFGEYWDLSKAASYAKIHRVLTEISSKTVSHFFHFWECCSHLPSDNNKSVSPFRAPHGQHIKGCHDQIHHLRNIFRKQILAPCLLPVMSWDIHIRIHRFCVAVASLQKNYNTNHH